MQLIRYTLQGNAVIIETTTGYLSLVPYAAGVVRVRYASTAAFATQPSLMVLAAPDSSVTVAVQEMTDAVIVSLPQLSIHIQRATCAFTYLDSTGALLTKEPDRGGKALIPVEVVKAVFASDAEAYVRKDVDGVRAVRSSAQRVVDRHAFHTKLEFEWQEGEALYGLGSHEEGMLNLRGQHQYLYQQNMKVVIPVLLSTRGYGILLDSYSWMSFRDDAFGSYLWTDVDDELDFYFIHGPEFDQIVRSFRQLTGRAPMLPRWAFGYIQSKERYVSQSELLDVVREYRARNLPFDCIVQDWKTWPNDLWGQKTFDPERFPDPSGLMAELHHLHARLMISIWPIMNPGGDNWREMRAAGCLLGNQATYDAFQERGRALYWQQANDGLFAHGIDAWWCDCTEPFQADWMGAFKPEPEERLRINTEEAKTYLDPEFISAYSLLHSQGIYEGQRRTGSEKRVVNLTRSGYGGQQRYSTITWSGDVSATWDTLRKQIADGLNFCAAGMPYWTTDVGAFFVKNDSKLWFWNGDYDGGVADLGYRELFVRWFQYAVFLPMLRPHGTDTPRELWRFGEPGEPFYDALVKFLRLRYCLIPYIYSLAGMVTHDDDTLLRALPFDFRADPACYNVDDQYMFGRAVLVCPVTQPMYYAPESRPLTDVAKTRSVYLPQGADWYDFWTGQRYAGGQTLIVEAGLDTLPVFLRAGSIVPLGPVVSYADEAPDAPLELRVYPGQSGSFTLYADEGDNYNYEQGQFATIRVSWDEAARRLTLHARQGSYPEMPMTREFRVSVGGGFNDAPTASQTIVYDGREICLGLT